MNNTIERRKRVRVALRCAVCLYRSGKPQAVYGETRDVSSAGFYCLTSESFMPGEGLDCVLAIPAEHFGAQLGSIDLHCEVKVARLDNLPSAYGLGCQIERYSLILRQRPSQ